VLKIFVFFVLLLYVEIKLAALVYSKLVATFNADAAFFLSCGYLFFTFYLASKIFKGTEMTSLSKFKKQFNQKNFESNELLTNSRRIVSALLIFIPGYLTDFLGFLIFISEDFSSKVFSFISKRIFQSLLHRGNLGGSTFHYSYKETRRKPSQTKDPDVLDVEYTEVHEQKIDR